MIFVSVLLSLLLAATTLGSPVRQRPPFPPIPIVAKGLLCDLPIPIIQKFLCPRQGAGSDSVVNTPIGTAHGVQDGNAVRFAVKYGAAARWQPSSVVTAWQLPNGATDPSALPAACPQDLNNVDNPPISEDCLSMLIYVPQSLTSSSSVPIMLWIHGGSSTGGAATFPGLDGANLATATNSIVAVIQYRLGALGFLAPNGNTNLGLKDVVTAMQFLHKVLPSFGGNPSKVTLAGQSSGGTMIRALLAAPSAASLFQSAILQSDPMDYGFFSTKTQQTLQTFFNGLLPCSTTNITCLNSLSVDDLLDAQDNLLNSAMTLDPSTGSGEPLRMVNDGTFIQTTLDDQSPFPAVSKPLLISNVQNEAGLAIYSPGAFDFSIGADVYDQAVEETFGDPDSSFVLNSTFYSIPAADQNNNNFDARPTLERLGTDQIWRCPTWAFARNWVTHGGNAFVGHYVVGSSYPGNSDVPFCTQEGIICHQDDIQIVFGTAPNPTPAQAALITEMQARYKAFLLTGNPNAHGFATWNPATGNDVHSLILGGTGEFPAGGCTPSFFGNKVKYDYQKFHI